MNGKQVRLSSDTVQRLEKVGKPFESVDDCVSRLLDGNCNKTLEKQTKNEAENIDE